MALVKEPIRPADRAEVYRRDGGCIAPLVDPTAGPCRRQDRRETDRSDRRCWTIDHVPPAPGAPRISTPRWMVTLCWGHHAAPSYWETAHRQDERDYLALHYEGALSMKATLILRFKLDLDQTTVQTSDQIATATRTWLSSTPAEPNPFLETTEEYLLDSLAQTGVMADENEDVEISVDFTAD